MNAHPKICR
uniref:Uncharacterized protein n=1 Tax=Arundo donax TaxID=35708 RepID=A0A0A8YZA9_ARUDO